MNGKNINIAKVFFVVVSELPGKQNQLSLVYAPLNQNWSPVKQSETREAALRRAPSGERQL